MHNTWDHMWVVAERDKEGHWRKLSKVAGEKFYLSAQDAFEALNDMDPEIAKSFGVFEIPCLRVFELSSPDEEGKSGRYDPLLMEKALLLIDGICLCLDSADVNNDVEKQISEIYKIAHTAHRHCGNPHEDWERQFDEVEKNLKSLGMMRSI